MTQPNKTCRECKKGNRFHWFYHFKERDCDGCGEPIQRMEGRYADKLKKKYYCRDCAYLIGIGYEWAVKKSEFTPKGRKR